MSRDNQDDAELLGALKSNILDSVALYFAPVKAVLREFQRAIGGNGSNPGGASPAITAGKEGHRTLGKSLG
jgi:hypothetical protein